MLPASYAMPAAVVLVVGGLLACFAGYRLFRIILGLYGFILGALITTSMMGSASTWALVGAGIVGGLVGALLMIAAYFVGVGLVGAGLAALVLNLLWRLIGGEPPTVVLVIVCVLGALGALAVARYVVIFGTALGGSWTALIGALVLAGGKGALRPGGSDVWILYPLTPLPERWWVTPAWLVLAVGGAIVQLATTRRRLRKRARSRAA